MIPTQKTLISCLALLTGAAASSNAAVLFTDNFDVNSGSWDNPPGSGAGSGPNHDAANPGRQGGSLATLGYTFGGNVQVGNTTTLPANSGSGSALGDDMLLAFGAATYLNHDFSTVTVPIEVTFRGLVSPIGSEGLGDWVSLIVGDAAGIPFVNGGNVSSVLFRANGGTEVWNHGSGAAGGSGFAPGFDVWSDYKVVLSDTAGTGSAFGSGGSRADYYINGSFLGTLNITQLTAGQGYFGFASNKIVGYDNVSISTIPEPSSVMAGIGGLAGLVLLRRRK